MAARKTLSRGAIPHKLMRDAIVLAVHRETVGANGAPMKKLTRIADRLVDKAIKGDLCAIRLVIERVDGKIPQSATDTACALEDFLERLDARGV
ncbi:MAG: hypothetical protein HY243_11035 [Proteobacteria bacterium]|nr:hypothetical protein [Pseudomonadota bacterium]